MNMQSIGLCCSLVEDVPSEWMVNKRMDETVDCEPWSNDRLILKNLAFDFCRFCVVIRFFHPRHNGQWPPTSKDFLFQILSITFIFRS